MNGNTAQNKHKFQKETKKTTTYFSFDTRKQILNK